MHVFTDSAVFWQLSFAGLVYLTFLMLAVTDQRVENVGSVLETASKLSRAQFSQKLEKRLDEGATNGQQRRLATSATAKLEEEKRLSTPRFQNDVSEMEKSTKVSEPVKSPAETTSPVISSNVKSSKPYSPLKKTHTKTTMINSNLKVKTVPQSIDATKPTKDRNFPEFTTTEPVKTKEGTSSKTMETIDVSEDAKWAQRNPLGEPMDPASPKTTEYPFPEQVHCKLLFNE